MVPDEDFILGINLERAAALAWLECYYAHCPGSPNFTCQFTVNDTKSLGRRTEKSCDMVLHNHKDLHPNQANTYNCTLTRQKRREEKIITVDHSIKNGKGYFSHRHNAMSLYANYSIRPKNRDPTVHISCAVESRIDAKIE
ncbi:hypothetical protein NHX12_008905 [Muraenolepis orangiensis]|uniref:Uncharacterized protein n=1 Tax=Muraenolepis orangiensis TaxID=630683 RepID=A0A9Q0DQT3_9TELE|nr:hypothetical protein NHX12_008905 [Muraenolepis orangiensis]